MVVDAAGMIFIINGIIDIAYKTASFRLLPLLSFHFGKITTTMMIMIIMMMIINIISHHHHHSQHH
jgi:hypothetical protein